MLFSSTVFLFCFLPLCMSLYFGARRGLRLYILLFSSLLFYGWGEPRYLAVMLFVCLVDYLAALAIGASEVCWRRRSALFAAACVNLGLLGYFKYFNFFVENFSLFLAHPPALRHIVMPIGISFFIFQGLSYVADVYRGEVAVQRSFARLCLYVSFFPQLIAGPIVRYRDIERDIMNLDSDFSDVLYGIKRFILGLGKKILIANPLGAAVDPIFDAGFAEAGTAVAWFAAIAYSLQLFFDFSGYSDMAIGLGRIFGFRFPENFNYPYISKSITEFWRRWHISLGTWFREYLYIPLGGNRRGKYHTYANLLLVFFVTGLWHGANWTFILWGLWHGLFILLERTVVVPQGKTKYDLLRHVYTALVFIIGWTMFRAPTVQEGVGFIGTMLGIYSSAAVPVAVGYYLTNKIAATLCVAAFFSLPVSGRLAAVVFPEGRLRGQLAGDVFLLGILLLSIASLAASTYNPFIYFRF